MPTEACWNVGPDVLIFLLDAITPVATAAYATRKLRGAYAGSALRVRRSSDNAELDIGFTAGGLLDTSALTTFVGANDGLVTKWYDQSLSGFDMAQATAATQPTLVVAGVLNTLNGNAAQDCASSQHLDTTHTVGEFATASAWTVLSALRTPSTFVSNPNTELFGTYVDGPDGWWTPVEANTVATVTSLLANIADPADKFASKAASVTTNYVFVSKLSGGTISVYTNGGAAGTATSGDIGNTTGVMRIGAISSGVGNDARINEILFFDTALASADLNILANGTGISGGGNMSTYAGTTWTTI